MYATRSPSPSCPLIPIAVLVGVGVRLTSDKTITADVFFRP